MGDRLALVPELTSRVLDGDLGWTVLETLCVLPSSELSETVLRGWTVDDARAFVASRRAAAARLPGEVPPAEVEFVRLEMSLPTPVAIYVDDTLQLATASLGAELPEDQAFAAVLAEASTDLPEEEVETEPAPPPALRAAPHPHADCEHRSTPRTTDPDRRCLALHRLLRRCIARLSAHRLELEDALFEFHREEAHFALGFRRFHDFAEQHLGLPERTVFDHLRNARLRRLEDPVALALRDGRVSRVQAALLEMARRLGIPRRDLQAWIEFAAHHTVRALRRAIHWARRRFATEAGQYTLEGCPPPSEDQLRTPAQSLESIAAQSDPPDPSSWLHAAQTRRTWILERDALHLYRRMAAALRPKRRGPRQGPPWWPLLHIFHQARQSWRDHYTRPIAHPHRKILERDEWCCSAPDCSSRRNLQVHHVRFRSQGGTDEAANLSTLCAFHHQRGVHGTPARLQVEGDAHLGRHSLHYDLGPSSHPRRRLSFTGERCHG